MTATPSTVSPHGLAFLRELEGFRARAYQDAGGIWTIGYGTTRGVRPGMTITRETAARWLARDLREAEAAVAAAVQVPLSQHEFDAVCAFVYNVGAGAFRRSTLLRKLNAGDRALRPEFLRWNRVKGRPVAGLTRRRQLEADLFEGKVTPEDTRPVS